MPYSEKQRRFAFAQLAKKKKGQKTTGFKGMSEEELTTYAHHPLEKSKHHKKRAGSFGKGLHE